MHRTTGAGSHFNVSRTQMRERAFAKVDTDSSGSIDTSELQSMVDDISGKTDQSLGSSNSTSVSA